MGIRVTFCKKAAFARCLKAIPSQSTCVKMPELSIAQYFALDVRDRAIYRDWLSGRHGDVGFDPPYDNNALAPRTVLPDDPRVMARYRDQLHQDCQLVAIKGELDFLWNVVSNTRQALDLDRNLGLTATSTHRLSWTHRLFLKRRQRHLTALHHDYTRRIIRLTGYLRAY
jgi:hypothetical protein